MEATVEVLTAEVRTLMVGSRQVTLSVYKQLDRVDYECMQPFGRVRSGKALAGEIELVGADIATGNLVRSTVPDAGPLDDLIRFFMPSGCVVRNDYNRRGEKEVIQAGHIVVARKTLATGEWKFVYDDPNVSDAIGKAESMMQSEKRRNEKYEALPLIVLAGLR